MPVVPTADQFGVAPTTGGGGAFPIGPNPEEIAGRQAQQLGAGMMQAGGAIEDIALDRQNIYDQVQVNNALNQARGAVQSLTFDPQVGYRAQKGQQALQRDSGQALPEEYGGKLQSALSNIADANLQTDQQRRLFQQHASALATQFQGDVESHMLQEAQRFRISTNDGTTDLALDEAKRNWQDPTKIQGALAAAAGAIYDSGKALGWAPAQVAAATLKATSSVHKEVILAALENNQPNYALPYLDRYKGQMTGDDILAVQGHVNQVVNAQMTQSAVQGATTDLASRLQPTALDRMAHVTAGSPDVGQMTNVTAKSESGDRQTLPNGQPVIGWIKQPDGTMKEGGIGRMQVLASTGPEAARLAGLPWDENRLRTDAAYNTALGQAYLQARLQKWGDPAKAWAAYTSGDGAVTEAIIKATAAEGSSANWLKYTTPRVQGYVTKNLALLGNPGDAPTAASTPPRPTEMEFVSAAIAKLPPGAPPQVVQATRTAAATQFGIINKTFTENGDNAVASAQRWLASNGGDFDNLPPEMRDAVTQFAPVKLQELQKFAHDMQRGVVPVTDPVLYNRLASHPNELAGLSDDQYEQLQTKLSPKDYDHFSRVRGAIRNQTPTGGDPNQVDFPNLNRLLFQHMGELGLPTSAKPSDTQTRADIGTTQKFVTDSVLEAQRQAGHKLSPGELNDHINFLFSKDTTFRNTLFGLDIGHTDPTPVMTLKFGDIPSESVDQIKAAFAKRGKSNPSNSDILNFYRSVKIGHAPVPPPRPLRRNMSPPVDPTIVEATATDDEE